MAQPPSGGCVLKPNLQRPYDAVLSPAAFRRLCVETKDPLHAEHVAIPAAFRRLCVETSCSFDCFVDALTSRLQAAVC